MYIEADATVEEKIECQECLSRTRNDYNANNSQLRWILSDSVSQISMGKCGSAWILFVDANITRVIFMIDAIDIRRLVNEAGYC